jgi:hypothetical protein
MDFTSSRLFNLNPVKPKVIPLSIEGHGNYASITHRSLVKSGCDKEKGRRPPARTNSLSEDTPHMLITKFCDWLKALYRTATEQQGQMARFCNQLDSNIADDALIVCNLIPSNLFVLFSFC